ncbi:hypothetical protein [Labilibaculum euxinus]
MENYFLEKAIGIALEAHKHQIDKSGEPYIAHLFRVMNMCKSNNEKICAILHDLIEDTEWTIEKLEAFGFPKEIIKAITCLTKNDDEDYYNYIIRISKNRLATNVKINDLSDNLDVKRLAEIDNDAIIRLRKYLKAYKSLLNLEHNESN